MLTLLVLILAGPQAQRWNSDLTVITVIDHSESVRRFGRPPPGRFSKNASGNSLQQPNGNVGGQIPSTSNPTSGGGGGGGSGDDSPGTIDDWLRQWVSQASADHRQDDRLGVVTYDARPMVRALPSGQFELEPGALDQPLQGTDTAAAMRLGMAMFPPDSGKRLVLVSDGNDTASQDGADILAAAIEAKAAGIPVDVLPINYQVDREVIVDGLYAPAEAREGQSVSLRAVLRATQPAAGVLYLKHDDQVVDLHPGPQKGLSVTVDQWTLEDISQPFAESINSNDSDQNTKPDLDGDNNTSDTTAATPSPHTATSDTSPGRMYVWMQKLDVPLAATGTNRFEVFFESAEGYDTLTGNNQAQSFTLVHGKGRVLFVDELGSPNGEILPKALVEHGVELDITPAAGLPRRLDLLQRYDAVIFQNVPAEVVSAKQQKMLASYVNDLGGGLIMIGGSDSFAAGGWTNSPVDQILPVSCQIPSQTVLPSGALVLVLDRSGSMGSNVAGTGLTQQELANEASVLALATLYPQDLVGVIAFDSSPKWVVQLQENSNPRAVADKIRSIHPGGGTDIFPALEEAYESLAGLTTQDAAVKHVILLTDGQSQQGEYYRIVGKMVQAGITISTVGVGDGVNNRLLNQLATMSGGTYHPIIDPNNLPQVFIKEARTIRKNLIKEVSFVPAVVATGSPIIKGVDGGMPSLHGFILTGQKAGAYTPMLGPEDEPIFAHWQVGLGRSAAFTSDATNRWARDWLTWGGYSDFWARVVRAISRPSPSRQYDLSTTLRDDKLHIRLDAVSGQSGDKRATTSAMFVNFLEVVGTVIDPNGKVHSVTLRQTGPGVYETELSAIEPGNYVVSLFVDQSAGTGPEQNQGASQLSGRRRQLVFGGASRPPGQELRRFRSNKSVLEQVASITGGRVLDPNAQHPATLFDRQAVGATRSIRPLWRPLMLVLLVIFLLDVASRRIAWDLAAIRQWTVDKYVAVTQVLRPRQVEAAETLAALKKRAGEVEEALANRSSIHTVASTTDANTTEASTAVSRPDADRKFEAQPQSQIDPDGNLADTLGAATTSDTSVATPKPTTQSATPQDTGPTTGRLLDAKRRARQRMETPPDE